MIIYIELIITRWLEESAGDIEEKKGGIIMNELMIFEGNNVEVFNWEDKVLFNPRDVGKCLEWTDSAIRMAISKMNKNQVIKLTNSDVKDIDFRKLNN